LKGASLISCTDSDANQALPYSFRVIILAYFAAYLSNLHLEWCSEISRHPESSSDDTRQTCALTAYKKP